MKSSIFSLIQCTPFLSFETVSFLSSLSLFLLQTTNAGRFLHFSFFSFVASIFITGSGNSSLRYSGLNETISCDFLSPLFFSSYYLHLLSTRPNLSSLPGGKGIWNGQKTKNRPKTNTKIRVNASCCHEMV
jgi:hypothetical protein